MMILQCDTWQPKKRDQRPIYRHLGPTFRTFGQHGLGDLEENAPLRLPKSNGYSHDLPRDMHPRKQNRSRSTPWSRDLKPVCEADVQRFEDGLARLGQLGKETGNYYECER